MVPRALLKITGECDSDCVFCHANGSRPGRHLPLEEISRRVIDARATGATGVVLSGGEPTRHPDLAKIASFIRKAGLELGLITNGLGFERALDFPDFLPRYVHVSLHGSTTDVHERLTRAPSFAAACRTIRCAARTPDIEVAVTTVVVDDNLDDLANIVDLVTRLGEGAKGVSPLRHRLTLLEPKGRGAKHRIGPSPQVAAAAIGQAIASGDRRWGYAIKRGWDGLPRCLAPAALDAEEHLSAQGILWMREMDEDRLHVVDHGARGWLEVCGSCAARPSCHGLYGGYLRGTTEDIQPLSTSRLLSHPHVFVGRVAVRPGPRCPLLSEGRAAFPNPHDTLLIGEVSAAPTYALCAKTTVNRPAPRLIRTRDVDGQIEGMVEGKIERLCLMPECLECSQWGRCPGVVLPGLSEPQCLLDDEVIDHLEAIEGLVLELPKNRRLTADQELRRHLRGQSIRRRQQRLDKLRAADTFDAVLALGGFDVNAPLDIVFRRIASVLTPGGVVVLTGKVPVATYGRHMDELDQLKGNFDEASGDITSMLRNSGLEVLLERRVNPETTAEWVVFAKLVGSHA